MIKLSAAINCWDIDASLKPLFETTKQTIREKLIRLIGVDIGKDITGGQAQKFFLKNNHDKIVSIVPVDCKGDFAHFLKEATFFQGVVCHSNPSSVFNLDEVDIRFKSFQVFIIDTYPNFDQPPYVHMGLLHTVQLLKRGKKSISSYGTQNKEAKNKMQRDFFESFSRKDDNLHALQDTFLRDALVTSFVVRSKGASQQVQKCSGCKQKGHRLNNCPNREGNVFQEQPNKFLDSQDFSDPLLYVRDGAVPEIITSDDSSDSESEEDSNDENDNARSSQTPVKSRTPATKSVRLGF